MIDLGNLMNKKTKSLRAKILRTSHIAKAGHVASAFSILEILHTLYSEMSTDDEFILSKGHGSLGLYAVLWDMGFITEEQLDSFGKYDSILGGHPDRNKVPKVAASTGSLGHGLPIAVGLAFSKILRKKSGVVYCLVGDGECNEGSVWESAILAKHLNLTNLVCIVDNNSSQIRSVPTSDIHQKFESFGFNVVNVEDGHDIEQLRQALKLDSAVASPTCIICNTVKGYGVGSISSDMFAWHHRPPTSDELSAFLKELES
jgi:transketolase